MQTIMSFLHLKTSTNSGVKILYALWLASATHPLRVQGEPLKDVTPGDKTKEDILRYSLDIPSLQQRPNNEAGVQRSIW